MLVLVKPCPSPLPVMSPPPLLAIGPTVEHLGRHTVCIRTFFKLSCTYYSCNEPYIFVSNLHLASGFCGFLLSAFWFSAVHTHDTRLHKYDKYTNSPYSLLPSAKLQVEKCEGRSQRHATLQTSNFARRKQAITQSSSTVPRLPRGWLVSR